MGEAVVSCGGSLPRPDPQSGDPACAWALTGPITAARPFQLMAFCLGLLCFFFSKFFLFVSRG